MSSKESKAPKTHQPYEKPAVKRIDLSLEETLSAGCKVGGTECTDPFPGLSQAGS